MHNVVKINIITIVRTLNRFFFISIVDALDLISWPTLLSQDHYKHVVRTTKGD